jgi:predicted Fe-Mo cluster-binding NifX family protein
VEVSDLRGRNAGSFRFIQANVVLSVHDLDLAHEVSQEIEQAVRKAATNVDDVAIHYAPYEKPTVVYAFTLNEHGMIAEHFGDAPEFEIVTVDAEDRRILQRRRQPNDLGTEEHGRGIKVAQALLDMGVDVVVTRTQLENKGPYFALHDARVRIVVTDSTSVDDVLESEGLELEAPVGD